MAFSCAYMLSKVRESDTKENTTVAEPKSLKRKNPFTFSEQDTHSESIIPEAIDVLDSIFSSLCPFPKDTSSLIDEPVPIEETNGRLFSAKINDRFIPEVIDISEKLNLEPITEIIDISEKTNDEPIPDIIDISEKNNNEPIPEIIDISGKINDRTIPEIIDISEKTSDEPIPEVIDISENIDDKPIPEIMDCSKKINVIPIPEIIDISEKINDMPLSLDINISENEKTIDEPIPEIIDHSEDTNDLVEETSHFDELDFTHAPLQVTGCWKEFIKEKGNNYTRGCKWAPDGSCILSCSDDNVLRLFNLPPELWDTSEWQDMPEMESVVKIPEGELIYDYSWYPLMNSSDPRTCCLASCSKNSPVHLWDGFTGELRCSYRTYDQMDEITAARSLSFDTDGQHIFCGFEKTIRIFNVDSPGRNFEERHTFAKKSGQQGIISCFAFTSANRNISAAGSYRKTIGIYSEPSGDLECVLEGQKGGVTQLQFSPDGNLLYSGGRKDPDILCWDVRNLGEVLFCLRRSCLTNQRMYFDISRCGRYVISGNYNGVITIWDTLKQPREVKQCDFNILEPVQFYLAHNDCVNGISMHPYLPLLCSSSGQRKFPSLLSEDEDEMFTSKTETGENSLRLWWTGKCYH